MTDKATSCYALDIVQIEEASLPGNSPNLEVVALPEDLQDNIQIEALYTYKHLENDGSFINYVIRSSNDVRYVSIGFSPDRIPIREMYAPEGEPSIINEHEIMIGRYTGQVLDDTQGILVPLEEYYIDFVVNGINYAVETHGLSEAEVITLIKSLL